MTKSGVLAIAALVALAFSLPSNGYADPPWARGDGHGKGNKHGGKGKGNFGKGGFDKEKIAENAKKREKLAKAAMADIEDVLTDEQRGKWKQMVGAPFDVNKLNQFGRGFGGFGGQGKGKGRPKDE